MRIELTQHHIKHGLRRSCRQCAVALALGDGLGKPMKVTGQFAYESNNSWDCVTGGERIAKIGRKLRFFINDFDTEPKAVKPVTLDFSNGIVDIVGDYEPMQSYLIHHIEHPQIQGKCGCIECEFGKDVFSEAERAKMLP